MALLRDFHKTLGEVAARHHGTHRAPRRRRRHGDFQRPNAHVKSRC